MQGAEHSVARLRRGCSLAGHSLFFRVCNDTDAIDKCHAAHDKHDNILISSCICLMMPATLICSSHVPEAVRQELSRRVYANSDSDSSEGNFAEENAVPVKVLPHSTCESQLQLMSRKPPTRRSRPRRCPIAASVQTSESSGSLH